MGVKPSEECAAEYFERDTKATQLCLNKQEVEMYDYGLEVLDALINTREFSSFIQDVFAEVNINDLKESLGIFGNIRNKISGEHYDDDNDDDTNDTEDDNNDNKDDNSDDDNDDDTDDTDDTDDNNKDNINDDTNGNDSKDSWMDNYNYKKRQCFEKDLKYLQTIVPDPHRIEGVILKFSDVPYTPPHQIKRHIYAMNTLILNPPYDIYETILIVFKKCEEQLPKNDGFKGWHRLEVLSECSFNIDTSISAKKEVAEIPSFLKDLLLKGDWSNAVHWLETGALKPLLLENKKEYMHNINHKEVEIIPLKELRKNPGWRKENEKELEIKLIHICKSCGKKANQGCCSDYHANNRTKIKMVLDWH
jgi:hypothetical protein